MRKTIKITLFFLPALLLLSQCRKIELPPATTEDPVFEVELLAGNTVLDKFTAGIDDYYLYTSYEKADDDVWTFIGEFRENGTQTGSPSSLRFEIRDSEANPITVDIDQALQALPYDFYQNNLVGSSDTTFSVQFTALLTACSPDLGDSLLVWDFGDGSDGSGYNPMHIYENNNERHVRLSVLDKMITQTVSFDTSIVHCSALVNTEFIQQPPLSYFELTVVGTGNAPFSYTWHNGATTAVLNAVDTADTFYTVTVLDNSGCEVVISGNTLIGDNCKIQFSYEAHTIIDIHPQPSQYSTITIIYVDENGEIFRSDLFEQANTSHFTIEDVVDFQENEQGEQTKKLTTNFVCELFSTNGSSVVVKSTNAVIAVAYPD